MNQDSEAIPPAAAASGGNVASGNPLLHPELLMRRPAPNPLSIDVSSSPSVDQKLFLVISVALATVCFFTNIVQVGVFLRPSALRSVKSLLLLSQAVSGVFASFVVVFPIHVISARGGHVVGESGFNGCYLGHSGIILVTVLTSLSTATMLLLHYYLTHNHPRKYTVAGSSLYGWAAIIGGIWLFAFGIAILPWLGWNSWETHDARCHLSTLWPLSFTTFLTFLMGLHMAVTLFLWASSRAEHLKTMETANNRHQASSTSVHASSGGNSTAVNVESDASPMTPIIRMGNLEGRVSVCGWAMTVSSIIPLLGHVVVASSCAASSMCLSSPHHYHEDAASLPWASLLLTAAAIANPLLYVFSDDQVSSTTLLILFRACCWWKKHPQQRMVPRNQKDQQQKESTLPTEPESNVYNTNDTEQLVGENT